MKRVCVIGGGAAGLMAAYAAAEQGNEVLLFEKNEKLGKKIYITGKGRCNFTNAVPAEEFLQNVVRGKKFLTGAIYSFPPEKTLNFFENKGLSVKIERGNRAFPASDHASDVTKTLENACKNAGVKILLNEKVLKIHTSMHDIIPMSDIEDTTTTNISIMPRVVMLETDKGRYEAEAVIVATGGISYPSTGSTGDGYVFAQETGHKVTDLRCGLCGINLKGNVFKDLQGLSLKNVTARVLQGQKVLAEEFGEMLFTHFGVSGPIILSISSIINRAPLNALHLNVDLKPALDDIALDKRLLRDFEQYKNKQISNALIDLLPSKLILPVLQAAGIQSTRPVNIITKEERARLLRTIKNFSFGIQGLRGFEEAIITSGGVDLSQINPKTMQSKKVGGLYFCGEVLDVDAFTGGFNMQIAFSTGYAAGKNA